MNEFVVVLLALALGSFGNVFLARFPQGVSLFKPGSQCPNCGHAIRWRHNIPVLGWLILRGRCADCRQKISARYPAMEAAFGLLAWFYVQRFGTSFEAVYYLGFLLTLVLVSWVDWETQYIFDVISLPLLGAGLLASVLFPASYVAWWDSVASAAAMALLMLGFMLFGRWLAGREAMGGGDLKLMAAVAAFLGMREAWKALGLGFLIGLPLMLLYMKLKGQGLKEAAPLGPGLCAAAALVLWNMLSAGGLNAGLSMLGMDLFCYHS